MAQNSFRKVDGCLADLVDGKRVLVLPDGTEVITLNAVGTMVWDALDEHHNVHDIASSVRARFDDVDVPHVTADVGHFLAELRDLGLVTAIAEP